MFASNTVFSPIHAKLEHLLCVSSINNCEHNCYKAGNNYYN